MQSPHTLVMIRVKIEGDYAMQTTDEAINTVKALIKWAQDKQLRFSEEQLLTALHSINEERYMIERSGQNV